MSRSIRLDVHAHLAPVFEERLAAVEGVTFDAGTTSGWQTSRRRQEGGFAR